MRLVLPAPDGPVMIQSVPILHHSQYSPTIIDRFISREYVDIIATNIILKVVIVVRNCSLTSAAPLRPFMTLFVAGRGGNGSA